MTAFAARSLHKEYKGYTVLPYRHLGVGWRCRFELSREENVEEFERLQLHQSQLAGAGDGFCAALHLKFVKDSAVVPFDRVPGEEKPFANLTIRESLGNQLEDFQLA